MHRSSARRIRRFVVVLVLGAVLLPTVIAQSGPGTVVSLNPLGILSGYIAASIEHAVGNTVSIYFSPSYYQFTFTPWHSLFPDVEVFSIGTAGGVNIFFIPTAPLGPSIGLGLVGGYLSAADTFDTVSGIYGGIELRLGFRVAWGKLTISPFSSIRYVRALYSPGNLGPATISVVNSLRNRFGIDPGFRF